MPRREGVQAPLQQRDHHGGGHLNNVSFHHPTTTSLLEHCYNGTSNNGVYMEDFPKQPPHSYELHRQGIDPARAARGGA